MGKPTVEVIKTFSGSELRILLNHQEHIPLADRIRCLYWVAILYAENGRYITLFKNRGDNIGLVLSIDIPAVNEESLVGCMMISEFLKKDKDVSGYKVLEHWEW